MANLKFKGVSKIYSGGIKAVSDFNLHIYDKEFIVLAGPSGCGKTTVLRMIAGLEQITSGELKIDDVVVNHLPPKERKIAMVFQKYALYPHMTVYENMAFGLTVAKVDKQTIKEKVERVAALLDITEYLGRRPNALSGGQQQRVALGRALVYSPKVFLLDEPLSNLDAKMRASMRTELIKLHKMIGATFIYVTHDQIEAMTMGSRIVVMKDGYIQQIGTPREIYDTPKNKFVAGFMGTPQINFFDVKLCKNSNDFTLSFSGLDLQIQSKYIDKNLLEYTDGRTVCMGIRAEDAYFLEDIKEKSDYLILDATVSLTEDLGGEILVYLSFGDKKNTLVMRSNSARVFFKGDKIKVALDKNKLKFFDNQTELSVLPSR